MAEFMRKIHPAKQDSVCEGRAVTSCQWDTHRTQLWENSVAFMSLALPEMPASTLITLGLSSGAPDSCAFPHHSHMAPSTPFYYLIFSLSSPRSPRSARTQTPPRPSQSPIPVHILLLRYKTVYLAWDGQENFRDCRDYGSGKLTCCGLNYLKYSRETHQEKAGGYFKVKKSKIFKRAITF